MKVCAKMVFVAWLWLLAGVSGAAETVVSRPVPADGGPTPIKCAISVLDVDEISDSNQNFTVNVFIHLRWDDPREAHGGEGNLMKETGELWSPRMVFLNRQRLWSSMEPKVEVTPEGQVTYRQQFWGDFSQPMNLKDFPFDTQRFEIRAVETGSEPFGALELIQDPEVGSFIVDEYSVADWRVIDWEVDNKTVELPNGGQVESFSFNFEATRLSNHFLIKYIAPLLLIAVLSGVVFWLDPKDGSSQLGVAMTACLTVIAYHVALSAKLPEIPYLTRFDVFVFGVTLMVFLTMIEVVVTTGLARSGKIAQARWFDRVSRLIFPTALVFVSVYSFLWH